MADIAVLGAGAIGGTVGALLHRAGHRVTLVGRADQVEAVRREGLLIEGALGTFTAALAAEERLSRSPELVLVAVKTQDVESVLRENAAYLQDVPLVTLQNGVRADGVAAGVVPPNNIVSAVVLVAASYLTAGRISIQSPGALVLGHPFDVDRDLVAEIEPILASAVATRRSDNVRGAHWMKLLMNLNNALPAATNLPLPEIYADPRLRRAAVLVIREGAALTRLAGLTLAPLPGVPLALMRLVTLLPPALAGRLAAFRIGRTSTRPEENGPLIGSTLQSLRRGRPTEIDYLNGEIVELGRQTGAGAPLNSALVRIVHDIERGGPFRSIDELAEEMRAAGARV
ncbi:ketopantoate reductase family protein [Salinispira pacifica]